MSIQIAVDGPAGSGKSTVAKKVADKLNLIYLDTGAMYRAVSLYMIENNISYEKIDEILSNLDNVKIELQKNGIKLNGKDVSKRIRERDVSNLVSKIASVKEVREKLVEMQRDYSEERDVILDGRDIGTVVFPNADLKIYLNASVEERAKRRLNEYNEKNIETNYDEIVKEIQDRDDQDTKREISPLIKAEDAIEIDTSKMSIEEVKNEIVGLVRGIINYR